LDEKNHQIQGLEKKIELLNIDLIDVPYLKQSNSEKAI
jgi:hypothetical protein